MDKEVALELLQRFLEKRGVELGCIKQLAGLVATGKLKGFLRVQIRCLRRRSGEILETCYGIWLLMTIR